jgi:hypothetical protein
MKFKVMMEFNESVLPALQKSPQEFASEIRLLAAAKWYELRLVSQEKAAEIAVLLKSELEFVLHGLFKKIVVPEAVWQEVSVYHDEAFKGLSKAMWVNHERVRIDRRIVVWNLGKGESQVAVLSPK